jgi:hypothetical protein
MMTRKVAALALAATVASTNLVSASAIAGKSCATSGAQRSVKSQSFTCKKVKGKLQWVASKATKVSPAPSPIPTTSHKEGSTFLPAEFALIGKVAGEKVAAPVGEIKEAIEVSWDPTTTAAKRKWMGEQIDAMKKVYTPLIPKGGTIRVIVMGSDVDWAQAELKRLSDDAPEVWRDYNDKFMVSTKCAKPDGYVIPDNKWPEPFTTYRGLGGGLLPGKAFAFVTMANCDDYIEKDILFHETFHAVQWLNSYLTAPYLGNQAFGWGVLPPWYREGQAQYFGMRMVENFGKPSVAYDMNGLLRANVGAANRWASEYEYLTTYTSGDAYWIGALMYEYLIAKFGVAKTLAVFDAAVKRDKAGNFDTSTRYAPFDDAFLEVFGQTRESFYEEVKPYIKWNLELRD